MRIATGPGWELRRGDGLDSATGLASFEHVDHVIADPPYGVHSHTLQRTINRTGRHEIDDLPFAPIDDAGRRRFARWTALRCRGWIVVFCELEDLGQWRDVLEAAGARWRRAGGWDRPATPQISADRPGQALEGLAITWAGKGRSVWNRRGRSGIWRTGNVWRAEGTSRRDALHPSQKPVVLMEALIADFTQPGDLVCDPFAGSGTTGVACIRLGRRFVGWEIDPGYFAIAAKRLKVTREQLSLFEAQRGGKQARMQCTTDGCSRAFGHNGACKADATP